MYQLLVFVQLDETVFYLQIKSQLVFLWEEGYIPAFPGASGN